MTRTRYPIPETPEEALDAAIERACARFAKVYGPNWYRWINLDALDLSEGATCIVGQLENHRVPNRRDKDAAYSVGTKRLGWDESVAWDFESECYTDKATFYGVQSGRLPFDGKDASGQQHSAYIYYAALDAAWRRKILQLRARGYTTEV